MNRVRSVARRELRSYFTSPIAYIFLLVFVMSALFTFFNVSGFAYAADRAVGMVPSRV